MKVLYALAALALATAAGTTAEASIYSTDFESPVGTEWSHTNRETSPSGRTFLGQFDNQTVSLCLSGLSPHSALTVSFELFIIQSWDGNNSPGPDVWDLSVDGGPNLLHTTFSNHPGVPAYDEQSYPDAHGVGMHPAQTGAAEVGTLGYSLVGAATSGDSVYKLSFTFAHSASDLNLLFSASGLQGIGDEGWGIDNVQVNANAIPEPSSLAIICGLALAVGFAGRRKSR